MTKPMIGVVPQPGETLPYSELRGLRSSPSLVLNAIAILSSEIFCFYSTILNSIIKNNGFQS